MKKNEERWFKIDIAAKFYCNLQPIPKDDYIMEISIRKDAMDANSGTDSYRFKMVGCKNCPWDQNSDIHIICNPGNYDLHVAETNRRCGIEQIMIRLCLNEAKIHQVNYKRNEAMITLKTFNANKEWVKDMCQKIVYLPKLPEPFSLATINMQSAISSNFNWTFIKSSDSMVYPGAKAVATEHLIDLYDGNGGILKDNKIVDIKEMNLFFCLMKYPAT